MLGHERFTVTPRRGELIVFDKLARPLVQHIVLAVPTKITKGVLIAPDRVRQRDARSDRRGRRSERTTPTPRREGLAYLRAEGARIMPELLDHEVTAVYAGLRAATEHVDYQLSVHAPEGYACVGGIRSTGLSASMAIAEHVREELGAAGLRLEPRAAPPPEFTMPNIGERAERPYQRGELIERDRDYGRIVCFCERVTRGEIRDALDGAAAGRGPRRPAPPHARAHGPLPGLLLRRRARRAARGPPMSAARGRDRRGARPGWPRRSSCGGAAWPTCSCSSARRSPAASRATRSTRASACATFAVRSPGPRYARRYAELAARGGRRAAHRDDGHRLARRTGRSSSPARRGASTLEPAAVVLATGCRERPRSARLVPGSRPEGVMTTGTLQQLVYLKGLSPGTRALVVGSRARELLRAAHARPRRGASRGHGHRAAAPPVARALPRRCGAALPDAALDAHRRHARSTAGRAWRRSS